MRPRTPDSPGARTVVVVWSVARTSNVTQPGTPAGLPPHHPTQPGPPPGALLGLETSCVDDRDRATGISARTTHRPLAQALPAAKSAMFSASVGPHSTIHAWRMGDTLLNNMASRMIRSGAAGDY
jgi:hypothetical protein